MASLFRRGNTYYVCFRSGGRLVKKAVGKSEKVARLRLSEVEIALHRGQGWLTHAMDRKSLPLRLADALAHAKTDLAPRTYRRYLEMGANLTGFFDDQEITPNGLERYKTHRLSQGVRCKTINNELIFARSLYVGNGYNPLSAVKNLKTRDSKEVRFLSEEEAARLLAACRAEKHTRDCPHGIDKRMRPDLAIYIEAYLLTGCRLSELMALTWADVQDSMIRVTNLKTYRSIREKYRFVPLHPRLREILDSRRHLTTPFPVIRANSLRLGIARGATRAGLTGAIGVHTLRHTFASLLVQKGVSLYVVSKLLGHSSQRTTEIYSHLVPETFHQAVRHLGGWEVRPNENLGVPSDAA